MNMVESLSIILTTISATILTSSSAAISTLILAAILNLSSAAIPTLRLAAILNLSSAAISTAKYFIYIDNYFISVPLFQLLHEHSYRACGTTQSKSAKFAF
jgi:hypothetical protein